MSYETDTIATTEIVSKHIVFEAVSGSHAYGLNTPASDLDVRGAFVCTPDLRIGLYYKNQFQGATGDSHFCEISQFFQHVAAGAPNFVELIFLEGPHLRQVHPLMSHILLKRDMFLTKTLVRKTLGFITGMVKRAERQVNMITLDDSQVITQRKKVMHAVRAAHMMMDLFRTGTLIVDRSHEREDLLALRTGERPLISGYAECDLLIKDIETNLATTNIHESCDCSELNSLVVELVLDYWAERGWC